MDELYFESPPEEEWIEVRSDVRTATTTTYSSPIFIKETHDIHTTLVVADKFYLNYRRCDSPATGGKFKITFQG